MQSFPKFTTYFKPTKHSASAHIFLPFSLSKTTFSWWLIFLLAAYKGKNAPVLPGSLAAISGINYIYITKITKKTISAPTLSS